jgi:hypothetical protein
MRDFHKMANSNVRDGVPDGAFPSGKSKQVYDVLYALTRGAIKPKRKIQIGKPKLMKLADVGSKVTIDNIINRFCQSGMLRIVDLNSGNRDGNVYEVFTYDEAQSRTSPPSTASTPSGAYNPGGLDRPETEGASGGAEAASTGIPDAAKTLFKDFLKTDDDSRVAAALKKLAAAGREATGRDLTKGDWEAFAELIDIFLDETAAARSRTATVSAFMKFGVENLRRRLYAARQERKPPRRSDPGKGPETGLDDAAVRKAAAEYTRITEREGKSAVKDIGDDDRRLWDRITSAVREAVPAHVYDNWFARLDFAGADRESKELKIIADTITSEWIDTNYADIVTDALERAGASGLKIAWSEPELTAEDFRAQFTPEDWARIEEVLNASS